MKTLGIDFNHLISTAQVTYGLILIVVLLMYIAFGKLDRELKSPKQHKV